MSGEKASWRFYDWSTWSPKQRGGFLIGGVGTWGLLGLGWYLHDWTDAVVGILVPSFLAGAIIAYESDESPSVIALLGPIALVAAAWVLVSHFVDHTAGKAILLTALGALVPLSADFFPSPSLFGSRSDRGGE